MGDAETKKEQQAAQPYEFPDADRENRGSWIPMAIGAALVAFAVGAVAFLARMTPAAKPNQLDPAVAKLRISDLHMATAENFVGGSVTYVEGNITNNGDRTVTGARVEIIFKNPLGEVAQKEVLPVLALLPNVPYVDYGLLDRAPLISSQQRAFRLILEHVTADWDGQLPSVRVVSVN